MSSPDTDEISRRRSTPLPGEPLGQPAAGTAPHEIAIRLVALRQATLAETGRMRRSLNRAYSDDVAVWAAWLQTHPDVLVAVLHLLVTEIAADRQLHGLDVVDAPTPTVPPDPDVALTGPAGAAPTALDRAAVILTAFPDWRIDVTLNDGSTVTARPAGAPLTPETGPQAPAPVPTDPGPADRRTA